jgi:hypothetical protein
MVLSVFVLDNRGVAVMPCTQKRARLLLARGRARVHRLVPFVIRSVDVKAQDCSLQPLSLKIDPGSKTMCQRPMRWMRRVSVRWTGYRPSLHIKSTGRGSYQRTRLDAFGFPRGYLMRNKSVKGFATGDLVKATVTHGKKQGGYRGRVAIRATGSFNIQTREGVVQGVSHRHCTLLQRGDGYGYQQQSKSDAGRDRASHDALCLPMDKSRGFSRNTR